MQEKVICSLLFHSLILMPLNYLAMILDKKPELENLIETTQADLALGLRLGLRMDWLFGSHVKIC